MRRPSTRTSVALASGVAAVALAVAQPGLPAFARVAAPLPDVLIKAVAANLAFGGDDADAAAAPAAPAAPAPAFTPFLPSFGEGFDPAFPLRPPLLPSSTGPCPEPAPNVFPEEPAGFDVEGLPEAGRYPYRLAGELDIAGLFKGPLTGTSQREVRAVSGDPSAFTYEYEQRSLLGAQVETYRVVPGDGIYLVRLQRSGGWELHIQPLRPVKLVALPISLNVPSQDAGVDPATLRVLAVEATVTSRVRINACGTPVEGWRVEGTRTITDPASIDATSGDLSSASAQQVEQFELVIAPHLAGLILEERLQSQGFLAGRLPYSADMTATINRLSPLAPAAGRQEQR